MQRKNFISVIAIATAGAALSACELGILGNTPESAVLGLYREIGQSEIEKARAYLHRPWESALIKNDAIRVLTAEATATAQCGGIKDVEVTVRPGPGDIRSSDTKVFYAGQCPVKVEVTQLMRVGREWKVVRFTPLSVVLYEHRVREGERKLRESLNHSK